MNAELDYFFAKDLMKDIDVYINHLSFNTPTSYHAHDFIEIAYIASGGGIHKIGDDSYTVNAGDITILNFDVPHQFIPKNRINCGTMTVYNCIFKPSFFDYSLITSRNFSDITRNFLVQSVAKEDFNRYLNISTSGIYSTMIFNIYEKMQKEYDEKAEGYIEILRAYLIELLVTIFRVMKKNENDRGRNNIGTEKDILIERIIEYMTNNFNEKISIEELSMQAFLSPSHFYRIFKERTGMNVTEFIQKIRIDEACNQLISTSKKIVDIANDVGYSDIKYFNKLFKKHTDKTPSEYRKCE